MSSTGVSIVESESGADGITVELEMQWDGNPNIVLDIRTRVGVGLPIQVKKYFLHCFSASKTRAITGFVHNSWLVYCIMENLGEEHWIHRGFQVNLQASCWWVSMFRSCFLFLERKGISTFFLKAEAYIINWE